MRSTIIVGAEVYPLPFFAILGVVNAPLPIDDVISAPPPPPPITFNVGFPVYPEPTAVMATSSSGQDYLGAYRSGNGFYNNNVGGNVTRYVNSSSVSDLYNSIRGANSRLVTISDCDFNFTNQQYKFGSYGSFEFGDGKLYACGAYNGNLTASDVADLNDYYNAVGFI